jgi:hypothetical protein
MLDAPCLADCVSRQAGILDADYRLLTADYRLRTKITFL